MAPQRSIFTSSFRRRRGPGWWLRLGVALLAFGWFAYSGVQVARGATFDAPTNLPTSPEPVVVCEPGAPPASIRCQAG